jgi:hypothetical protein
MKPKLENFVTNVEMSLQLKAAGIQAASLYGYFKDDYESYQLRLQDAGQTGLAAYTSGELIELLPATLDVDTDTYKATMHHWIPLAIGELGYPYAHVQTIKADGCYLCGYFFNKTMIAFTRTEDGKYKNLLLNGDTEQEARAELLLALISEGKLTCN